MSTLNNTQVAFEAGAQAASLPPARDHLADLLVWQARARGQATALRYKRRGVYRSLSWSQAESRVSSIAGGLTALGFEPGSVLLALGDMCPDWLWTVLAVHRLGGTVLALSAEVDDAELERTLHLLRVRFVFAEHANEVERVLSYKNVLAPEPLIIHGVSRGLSIAVDPTLRSLESVIRLGERAAKHEQTTELQSSGALAPAFISFNTLSDGSLKRTLAQHATLVAAARAQTSALSASDNFWLDASLRFQAERLIGIAEWLVSGACLGLGEHASTSRTDQRELGPSRLPAGSGLYEALWYDTEARLPRKGSLGRELVDWALRVGARPSPGRSAIARSVANQLVLRALADGLGLTRVKLALSAGASPTEAVRLLFDALAVPLQRIGDPISLGTPRELALVGDVHSTRFGLSLHESEGGS